MKTHIVLEVSTYIKREVKSKERSNITITYIAIKKVGERGMVREAEGTRKRIEGIFVTPPSPSHPSGIHFLCRKSEVVSRTSGMSQNILESLC